MDSIGFYLSVFEEEIVMEIHRNLKNERRFLRNMYDPLNLDDIAFIKNFRLSKDAFNYVLIELETEMPPIYKSFGLTAKQKLCALLRFLAEGSYQHGVGKDFDIGMAQSTISISMSKTLDILQRKLCPKWIKLGMTAEEKQASKSFFYDRAGIPGVIMCVDGTHIKLLPPAKDKHLYYNRKGFFSLNAMIICDNTLKIRYIDSRYPGCNHDSLFTS